MCANSKLYETGEEKIQKARNLGSKGGKTDSSYIHGTAKKSSKNECCVKSGISARFVAGKKGGSWGEGSERGRDGDSKSERGKALVILNGKSKLTCHKKCFRSVSM